MKNKKKLAYGNPKSKKKDVQSRTIKGLLLLKNSLGQKLWTISLFFTYKKYIFEVVLHFLPI